MKKFFSKVLKIALYTLLWVLGLLVIISLLVRIPAIQSKIVNTINSNLSEQLQTELSISSVNLGFTGKLYFEDVLVRDQKGDTLFFIQELKGRLWSLSTTEHSVELRNISLTQPTVNFVFREGQDEPNYQFFIDFFQAPASADPPAMWTILFKQLQLEDGSFNYKIEGRDPAADRDFDENDFAFKNIHADLLDFYLIADSLDFKIKRLSTVEKNGLRVKHMACKAKIHYTGMSFEDLVLNTDHSHLEDKIVFSYPRYPALSSFIDSVYMNVNLEHSTIDTRDLAYFSHSLKPYQHNIFKFTGKAKGTIKRLKVRNVNLMVGNETRLKGEFDFTGLPNWESCFSDIDIESLATTPDDIQAILNLAELPDQLEMFGSSIFSGHLTGFQNDFAADGDLVSALGSLSSRINFKLENEIPQYKGELTAENFNLGAFLKNEQLGNTSFHFNLKEGSGLTFKDLYTSFKSEIFYIDFNGYRINNLTADGIYQNKSFDGEAIANDPNVNFTFNGKMDFNPVIPTYKFEADIQRIDLYTLKLDSVKTDFSSKMEINLAGSNLDNLDGNASLTNIHLKRGIYNIDLDTVTLESKYDDNYRQVNLRSDILDATIEGRYNFSYLDQVYIDILHTLFPDYYVKTAKLPNDVELNTLIEVRENEIIGQLVQRDLKLGNGIFSGVYNSSDKSLELDGKMDQLIFQELRFENYYLNVRKKPYQLLNMSTDVARLFRNDSLLTRNILLNASILPNDIDFLFNFADTTDELALRSYGALHFTSDTIDLRMMSSKLYVQGNKWKVNDLNQIVYTKEKILIEQLSINRGNEWLMLNGVVSESPKDKLILSARSFDLTNLNPVLSTYDVSTSGIASGTIDIFQVYENPVIHANMNIEQLVYNEDTLGNLHVETSSGKNPLIMDVKANVTSGILKDVGFSGDVDLTGSLPRFDMSIYANDASVKPLENIFEGLASDFNGTVTANIRFKGNQEKYSLKGKIEIKQVGITVDYLNTRYIIDDNIYLSDEIIDFKTTRIKDIHGNTALLRGTIKHNLFSGFYFDLHLDNVKKLMCLNTTKSESEVFYGTGYASGKASFTGPIDNMVIDIEAQTEKGTRVVIPLYDGGDNQLVDYISFKKPIDTTTKQPQKTRQRKQDGITVKMQFTISEEAEFVLLFDEILDDKISASGNGNITMTYTSYEDFYMYGDFRIKRGIYPFSSPTLVSEKFDLREGGRIVWNGDPFNAQIDLQASVARNRANPLDLMMGYVSKEDESRYNTNIKMNVILDLQGELFNPDINFGMEFPDKIATSGLSQFNSMIKRIENDPDELNRQVFSLLTFGSFTPTASYDLQPGTGGSYRDIVSSSVGSFLSNQVNNWISEYDQNWELGVDYKTRTGITDEEKAELIVSARRKLFNERLEVAGSYNAYSTGSINPYNVDLVYNVKKDGTLKLKVYHKLANDPTLGQVSNVTTSGIGFYFKKQFERIRLFGKKEEE